MWKKSISIVVIIISAIMLSGCTPEKEPKLPVNYLVEEFKTPNNFGDLNFMVGPDFRNITVAAMKVEPADPMFYKMKNIQYQIDLFLDYSSLDSAKLFVEAYPILNKAIKRGDTILKIYPTYEDNDGGRGMSLAGCVTHWYPDSIYDFHYLYFYNYLQTGKLANTRDLLDIASQAGAAESMNFTSCYTNIDYKKWTEDVNKTLKTNPLPSSNGKMFDKAPIMLINADTVIYGSFDETDYKQLNKTLSDTLDIVK